MEKPIKNKKFEKGKFEILNKSPNDVLTCNVNRLIPKMYDKSHGSKLVRGPRLSVMEQGDNFDYYHVGRNEPVPPCPTYSSACKQQFAVPPPPQTVIKHIAPAGFPVRHKDANANGNVKVTKFWEIRRERSDSIPFPGFRDIEKAIVHVSPEYQNSNKRDTEKLVEARKSATDPDVISDSADNTAVSFNASVNEEKNKPVGCPEMKNVYSSVYISVVSDHRDTDPLQSSTEAGHGRGRGRGKGLSRNTIVDEDGFGIPPKRGITNHIRCETSPAVALESAAMQLCVESVEEQEMMMHILNVCNENSFMIRTTDINQLGQLETLESEMFTWHQNNCELNKDQQTVYPGSELRCFSYYAVLERSMNICYRVRLMSLDEFKKTATVIKIDHGTESVVPLDDVIVLQEAWKGVPQMCCRAKYFFDESRSKHLDENYGTMFREEFQDKLSLVELVGVETISMEKGKNCYMERCAVIKFVGFSALLETNHTYSKRNNE